MVKIGPKGPYNPFFRLHNHFIITIIIIHKYPHKDAKFCIWSVYNSTTRFKIVNDAKRTIFVAVVAWLAAIVDLGYYLEN